MPTTILATDRIELAYIVDGHEHKCRLYCKRVTTLTTGHQSVTARDGSTLLDWTECAQAVAAMIDAYSRADANPLAALQTQGAPNVWNPIDFFATSTPGHGGAYQPASEITFVLRDTAFTRPKFVLMEGSSGYVGHSADGSGMPSAVVVLKNSLDGTSADPHDPYNWMKSLHDNYLLASGTIAGATLDLNDKLKRMRGLE